MLRFFALQVVWTAVVAKLLHSTTHRAEELPVASLTNDLQIQPEMAGWLRGRDWLPLLIPDFLPGDIPEGGSRHGRRTAWLLP